MMPRLRYVALAALMPLLLGYAQHSAAAQKKARTDSTSQNPTKNKKKYPTINVGGYLQVFYKVRKDDNGDGTTEPDVFRVQRARISFKGDVSDHVAYEIDMDPRAPEVGGILRDAFIKLDYIPKHEIRVGQQKTLFGYENPISSSRLFVVNRSEVSDNLSRGINLRDIGVGLVGSLDLSKTFRLEDAVTVVNGQGFNVQADSTHRKNVWGRLGVRYRKDSLTIRLGISGASGDQNEPGDPTLRPPEPPFKFSFTRLGTDLVIDHPLAFFAAEYVTGQDRTPPELGDIGGGSVGWYAIAAGKTHWNIGPIARFDVFEEFRRLTLGGYVGLPVDNVSLLFNYEIFKDEAGPHDHRIYLRLQVRF